MKSKDKFFEIYFSSIERDGRDDLYDWLTKTDFFDAPASTRYHADYEGGLCEHSIHVWEELVRLIEVYPQIHPDPETVAIVSLLHDLCKIGCYKTELRNKKENGVWHTVPVYTYQEDFCFGGHGSKSVYLVQKFMPLRDEEAVAINCHMGFADQSPNDFSRGNAFGQFPLAWLLHVADESATYLRET